MKSLVALLAGLCLAPAFAPSAAARELRVSAPAPAANGLALQWTDSAPNQAYTVQGRARLHDGLWLTLDSPEPWPITQRQWTDPVPADPARFYRVIGVEPADRGRLLSSTLTTNFSATLLNLYFLINHIPLTAQYGVNCYRIVYETIDPLGGRTVASGGLYLPQSSGNSWPLFSFSHGTITETNEAPSASLTLDALAGVAFATAGYVGVVADLLGLGASPGFHPYLEARSEATASVDMLRAARNYCANNGISLNGQLFLAGYSQGGHTEMALHRELERYHTNEFTVTASAPMAGPYDLSGVELNDLLSGRCPPNPYYAAYVLESYQSVYGLAPAWSDLLAPPYDVTIPPLFNGNTSGSMINAALPACGFASVLTPATRASVTNDPGSPLYLALRANDVYRWRPVAPVRLFHCSGDQDVLPANSQVAYTNFLARGATDVQLVDPSPGANHGDCVIPSVSAAKAWFDSLKR